MNSLDPRIKGHLLKLLLEAAHEENRDREQSMALCIQAVEYADQHDDAFGWGVSRRLLATTQNHLGKYDEAIQTLIELREMYENEQEYTELAHTLEILGTCYYDLHQYDIAEQELLKSINLYEQCGLFFELQRSLRALAVVYMRMIRYTECIEILYRSQEIAKKTNLVTAQDRDRIVLLLGIVNAEIGNHEIARENFFKNLVFAREIGDLYSEITALCNIGTSFAVQDQDASAIEYFLQSLKIENVKWDVVSQISTLSNLAVSYLKVGNLDGASKSIEEAYKVSTEKADDNFLHGILTIKGQIKMAQGDSAAEEILLKALALSRINKEQDIEEETLLSLSEFYTNICNWEVAIFYYKRWHEMVFSLSEEKYNASLRIQERLASEQRLKAEQIIKLKLDAKESELATKALAYASQTELIATFREDLRRIIRKIEARDPAINELIAKLKELPDGVNWKEFESQFKQVHPEFKTNLQKKFPDLSEDELQVCVLFRLKLKSPDIGKLLSLSFRTVQNRRNRIRKKLALKGEDDIAKFLAAF